MRFTLGDLEHALDGQMRTHVAVDADADADADGRVHGVTTWMPVHRDGRVTGWTLDPMRRRADGFRPVVEFLIAEAIVEFQAQGYETVSLSIAPLARHEETNGRGGWTGSWRRYLGCSAGVRLLLVARLQAKFGPRFVPVHLVYPSSMDLPRIAAAIGHAYLPDLTMRQAGRLLAASRLRRRPR